MYQILCGSITNRERTIQKTLCYLRTATKDTGCQRPFNVKCNEKQHHDISINNKIFAKCLYLTLHTLAVDKLNSANSSFKNHCCFLAAIWAEKEQALLEIIQRQCVVYIYWRLNVQSTKCTGIGFLSLNVSFLQR